MIYSELMPTNELFSICCVNAQCKRRLFDVKGRVGWITNSGLPYEQLDPSIKYSETVCHSCKIKYKFLFQ